MLCQVWEFYLTSTKQVSFWCEHNRSHINEILSLEDKQEHVHFILFDQLNRWTQNLLWTKTHKSEAPDTSGCSWEGRDLPTSLRRYTIERCITAGTQAWTCKRNWDWWLMNTPPADSNPSERGRVTSPTLTLELRQYHSCVCRVVQ